MCLGKIVMVSWTILHDAHALKQFIRLSVKRILEISAVVQVITKTS